MNRRDLLRLGGPALAFAFWPSLGCRSAVGRRGPSAPYLFVSPADLGRIRAAARTPLLAPVFDAWAAVPPAELVAACTRAAESGNIINDLREALQLLTRQSTVQLIAPTAGREQAMLTAIEAVVALPKWDYFLEGGTDVIGIMRSSLANSRLLYAREVLGEAMPEALDTALLDAVAEKGCLPCYRTIYGMDHPDEVVGWSFDEAHHDTYDISLERWPEILGANNLRAVPTMGLGLGALALVGHDERADVWLDTATASARHFLSFISRDGSYFEGLSYIDYALRTLLQFVDAHARLVGSVDWAAEANWGGILRFILTMQAGQHGDGRPDIVNFSDARKSVFPSIPAWIGRTTMPGVAQFAAENVSEPGFFLDFLWYEPERASEAPPEAWKNARLDLDWVIARTGWQPEDAVLAFRSGGPANHEHADRNSFLFKAYGERLLTDPVGAAYDARDPGWLLRLTEAHNAILIDGRGHQYHNGEEGTNEGLARAEIVRYEPDDERVWWVSDATHGYALVDADIEAVMRTVCFAKPDVVVILDQVRKRTTPSTIEARFFPDNHDGRAAVGTLADGFTLRRPAARLDARLGSERAVAVRSGRLDLPDDRGDYPYVALSSAAALRHELVTVLAAAPADATEPRPVNIAPDASGWTVEVGAVRLRVETTPDGPQVHWV